MGRAWLSSGGDHVESLPLHCGRKPLIQAHKIKGGRPVVARQDRRSQLQRIGNAKIMHAQQAYCCFLKRLDRLHLLPSGCQRPQTRQRLCKRIRRYCALPLKTRQCGNAFHTSTPPSDYQWVFPVQVNDEGSSRLLCQKRDNRGTVPELHRLSSRSENSA